MKATIAGQTAIGRRQRQRDRPEADRDVAIVVGETPIRTDGTRRSRMRTMLRSDSRDLAHHRPHARGGVDREHQIERLDQPAS